MVIGPPSQIDQVWSVAYRHLFKYYCVYTPFRTRYQTPLLPTLVTAASYLDGEIRRTWNEILE